MPHLNPTPQANAQIITSTSERCSGNPTPGRSLSNAGIGMVGSRSFTQGAVTEKFMNEPTTPKAQMINNQVNNRN